jgi:hypothetical protein
MLQCKTDISIGLAPGSLVLLNEQRRVAATVCPSPREVASSNPSLQLLTTLTDSCDRPFRLSRQTRVQFLEGRHPNVSFQILIYSVLMTVLQALASSVSRGTEGKNGELEGLWQEAVVACWRHYGAIFLEGLRQNEEVLSHCSRYSRKPLREQNFRALQLLPSLPFNGTTPVAGAP